MERFISKQKLGKKAQKELNSKKRQTWGSFNPVTRKTENKKAYHRKKVRWNKDDFPLSNEPFLFYSISN